MNGRLCAAVVLCVLALSAPATAQVFSMARAVDPGARIAVNAAFAYRRGGTDFECVTFTNHARKTATFVQFAFTYFDAAHRYDGSDTFDRSGSFAPDVKIDGHGPHGCERFRFPREGIAVNIVSVRRVTYVDGSSWSPASTVAKPAVAAAAAPPIRVHVTKAATPLPTETPYVAPFPTNRP